MEQIAFAGRTFDCPYYHLLPRLTSEEFDVLLEDVRQNGLHKPIFFCRHNGSDLLIDGHHRGEIAGKLGLTAADVPLRELILSTEEERRDRALALNLLGRLLSREQRSDLIVKLRQAGYSYRSIAAKVGVTPQTAANAVQRAKESDTPPTLPDKVKGSDGSIRPAAAKRIEPERTPAEAQPPDCLNLDDCRVATPEPPPTANGQPAAPGVCDALGQRVPPELEDSFGDSFFRDARAKIESAQGAFSPSTLRSLAVRKVGWYPFFRASDFTDALDAIETNIEMALAILDQGTPHAICPLCQGSGEDCEGCREGGHVTDWRLKELRGEVA